MGKKSRKRGRHPKQRQPKHQPAKRPKRFRCWIEDCPETVVSSQDVATTRSSNNSGSAADVDVTLVISRVLLFDNHASSRTDLPRVKDDEKKKCMNHPLHGEHAPVSAATATGVVSSPTPTQDTATAGTREPKRDSVERVDTETNQSDEQPSNKQVTSLESSMSNHLASTVKTADKQTVTTTSTTTTTTTTSPDHVQLENARIAVQRHVSAHGAVTFPRTGYVHLPNGDCGDGIINPYPDTVEDKYWAQRHRLFVRFEQGIQLDQEGWFSVTPEAIADHVAHKMTLRSAKMDSSSTSDNRMIVLDAFVGVGGNAIAFAKRDEVALVLCCDTDPKRLAMAANNCKVYDIPADKVVFVCADAAHVLESYQNGLRVKQSRSISMDTPTIHAESVDKEKSPQHGYKFIGMDQLPDKVDAIFLSPPWGGSAYANQRHFDLKSIKVNDSVNGEDLLELAVKSLPKDKVNLAYFLPRNTNGWRVGQCAYNSGLKHVEMEQNYLNHKLKTVTLYAGTEYALE